MRRYIIAPAARRDLKDIYHYIAQENRSAARRMMKQFYDAFALLLTQPLMGEVRPDLRTDLRLLSIGNYAVIYRVLRDELEIVRVLHGARDIQALF